MPSYVHHTMALQDATSFSLTKPTCIEGDLLLLLWLESADSSLAVTGGTTWSATTTDQVAYKCKFAGPSEPSTYSVTGANTFIDGGIYWLGSFRDPRSPTPVVRGGGLNTATQVYAPGFTPSGLSDIDIRVAMGYSAASSGSTAPWSTPAGYTAVGYVGAPATQINMSVFYKQLSSAAFSPQVTMDNAFNWSNATGTSLQLVSSSQGFTGWGMPI